MIGKIRGTGSYVPGKVLDNNDLAKIMDLIHRGVMGNLVEMEDSDGAVVHIFVE